jgi:hypothetical protein
VKNAYFIYFLYCFLNDFVTEQIGSSDISTWIWYVACSNPGRGTDYPDRYFFVLFLCTFKQKPEWKLILRQGRVLPHLFQAIMHLYPVTRCCIRSQRVFRIKFCTHFSSPSCVQHVCPSHLSFGHSNNIWLKVKFMEFLILHCLFRTDPSPYLDSDIAPSSCSMCTTPKYRLWLCIATLFSLIRGYQRFGRKCFLHLQFRPRN